MIPFKVLGLDLETNGLDIETSRPLEIGFAVLDCDRHQIFESQNYLCNVPDIEIMEEAYKVHGITKEALVDHGRHPAYVIKQLDQLMRECNVVCAHNGTNFDKPILEREFKRVHREMPDMLWIDTAQDIEFPENISTRKMGYLAVEHGFMNPFPHRAIFDVVTMLRVLDKYDIETVVKSAQTPIVRIRACVGYDDRQLAKDRRYNWEPEKKIWFKDIKEHKVEREMKEAPFKVVVIGGAQT